MTRKPTKSSSIKIFHNKDPKIEANLPLAWQMLLQIASLSINLPTSMMSNRKSWKLTNSKRSILMAGSHPKQGNRKKTIPLTRIATVRT